MRTIMTFYCVFVLNISIYMSNMYQPNELLSFKAANAQKLMTVSA